MGAAAAAAPGSDSTALSSSESPRSRSPRSTSSNMYVHHKFLFKNDLARLCRLYTGHTHRRYWQAPNNFVLSLNFCTAPDNLVVGYSEEEFWGRYWQQFSSISQDDGGDRAALF